MFNDGKHLISIINLVGCKKHKRPSGIPCFHVPKTNGFGYYAGICNKRALAAGHNGKISASAYQLGRKSRRA